MKRIKLTVAYDGTNYHGWQVQPNADTIEGELNKAISELTGEQIEVIGASRTDAGVHALGNVAVFDTESRIPGEKFSYALNQRLPEDIIIQKSEEVDRDFHPRYQECRKTYEYTILNRRFPLPEYRNTAHFDYGNLDIEAMKKACKAFIGEHDFAGFCSAGAQVKTTVRTIYSLEVECMELGGVQRENHAEKKTECEKISYDVNIKTGEEQENNGLVNIKVDEEQENNRLVNIKVDGGQENNRLIKIRVNGNGFLYNMVRIIAGTLLEVGKGNVAPEQMEDIIKSADRKEAGPTAPAKGLKLVEIRYV